MSSNSILWLAVLATVIHVMFGALQSDAFNKTLAIFSLPPIPTVVFPWLGLALGFGSGLVDSVQKGMSISAAAATAIMTLLTGGASALHVDFLRGETSTQPKTPSVSAPPVPVIIVAQPVAPAPPVVTRTASGRYSIVWPGIAFGLFLIASAFAIFGCGTGQIFGPGSNIPGDLQAEEECVSTELLPPKSVSDPVAIALACAVPEDQALVDLMGWLAKAFAAKGKITPVQLDAISSGIAKAGVK